MKTLKLSVPLLIGGLLLFALVTTWVRLTHSPIAPGDYRVIYHFKPGFSTHKLAADLQTLGVLRRPGLFKRYVKYRGLSRQLQAGVYAIDSTLTLVALVDKLRRGDILHYDIALIEGWTLAQCRQKLANSPGVHSKIAEADLLAFVARHNLQVPSAEGLFLPETYRYPHGFSDRALLEQAHEALIDYITKAWETRAPGLPYTHWYQALIVASLIEKETMLANERGLIAGVIMNRLAKNMILQIDASVIYGLGQNFLGPLRREHLRKPSPYNTYLNAGLPPTPIALPSRESIDAALHPQKTDYYYFVATGDGGHYFSKTLPEHNRAVRQYILNNSDSANRTGAALWALANA